MKSTQMIDSINIDTYMKNHSLVIERKLEELVPEQNISQKQLFLAARYALLGSGKRLRPILALATAEAFGGTVSSTITAACALEMIHSYSLVHDDLPCMDDDDYRRGKLSVHKVYGDALAVLTGDYLLTLAFEVIASDDTLSALQKVDLIRLFSQSSGGNGMLGGQIMDIQSEGGAIDLATLDNIYCHKTGALILAAILCGGIVGKATAEEMEYLRLFGNDLGLAFQIIDDVIDVISPEQKHGKKTPSDAKNNKTTYVTLMGIEAAKQIANDLYDRALIHLSHIDRDTTLLQMLAKKLVHRLL